MQGNSSFEADKKAMGLQAVMEQVAGARNVLVTENNPVQWLAESQNRSELRKINKAMALKSESDRKSEIKAAEPNLADEALTQKTYEQMLKDISEKLKINSGAILGLALGVVTIIVMLMQGWAILITMLTVLYPSLQSIRAVESH